MTIRTAIIAAGLAAGIGISALAYAHDAGNMQGQGGSAMGPGMMGQGAGPGYGMGPGMAGQGMGPGYGMGPGMAGQGMYPGMMMGRGMGPGYGMGPGMMGQGMYPGMMMGRGMGPGMMMGYGMMGMGPNMMAPLRQDLDVADVKHILGHRLEWGGNPNLKLGKVEAKDDDTIVADIVTKDGSLVQEFEVNRHTGWMQPAQ